LFDISFSFEDTAGAHSSADAHAYEAGLLLGALQLVEQCHNHASTGHAEGVTHGDSTTSRV